MFLDNDVVAWKEVHETDKVQQVGREELTKEVRQLETQKAFLYMVLQTEISDLFTNHEHYKMLCESERRNLEKITLEESL